MDYTILDFLRLLGSLGVFLFGMKMMSESLQQVAGKKMRTILTSMTSNRVKGLFTGLLITSIIQSSSATTVMVVSFVNAGLLSLVQSIGVIMGANIGTTVTAWLISILGFKVSMAKIALPLIGFALPLLFTNDNRRRSIGEFIFGFAFLFVGLEYLKESVPDISHSPEVFAWIKHYSSLGYAGYLLFVLIGTFLTIVIQSSSATMALTLVMCSNGWIQFDLAAAMVLGENIGTTITANLAALVANANAKRAARAHFIFNLFGVFWILLIFPYFLKGIALIVQDSGGGNPFESFGAIPIALSLFHTLFNSINTLILIWFVHPIAKIVTRMVPEKAADDEVFTLQHIKTGLLSTPEASLFLARKEVALYGQRVTKMFNRAERLFKETDNKKFRRIYEKLLRNEESCDKVEVDIADYLTKVSEANLSERSSKMITSLFKQIDNIESIGDSCHNIGRALERAREKDNAFAPVIIANMDKLFRAVNEALRIMEENLSSDSPLNVDEAFKKELEINALRDRLKTEHLENLGKGIYDYQTGIIYNDIFSECEKLGDYVINVTQSLSRVD
jgi:phosphate:Na+ symporter